jgi:hypothetical protein
MKSKVKNIILSYGLDVLFVLILTIVAFFIFSFTHSSLNIFLFFTLMIIFILPMFNHLHDIIDSQISPLTYEDMFIQTVDSILNIESFNEMLKSKFELVLDLINVRSGLLIFYYPDTDEYSIFYQKNRRKRIVQNARVEIDNVLFKAVRSSDDIIERSRLDPGGRTEGLIIKELDRINGEVVVPVYSHDIFLGIIIVGKRSKKFSEDEIRLLKILASKLAMLSVNTFFFKEMVRKKEIEKEFETASKIHRRFMPDQELGIGRYTIRIHHEMRSKTMREFYDIYSRDREGNGLRISAYRIRGNTTGASIYMPGIQALLQSYARLDYQPAAIVSKLYSIVRERILFDEEITLLYASVNQEGQFLFSGRGYPPPIIFNNKTGRLRCLQRGKKMGRSGIMLAAGDIILIVCESFYKSITADTMEFNRLIRENISLSAGKLRGTLLKYLIEKTGDKEQDELMIFVRTEAAP